LYSKFVKKRKITHENQNDSQLLGDQI